MAGLNFGNGNEASGGLTKKELFKAYSMATGTAIGVACSMRALAPLLLRGRSKGFATAMNYVISYTAVACSSATNVYAMRKGELKRGVAVTDEKTGEKLGLSKVAAK